MSAIDLLVRAAAALMRARRRVITLGIAVAMASLPFAVLLYGNLRSAIEELLPVDAPSLLAINALHERLGDNLQLTLLMTGAPAPDMRRVADRLAQKARTHGPGGARLVDYRPAEVQGFFKERQALFLELADLQEAERRLRARVEHEVARKNPLSLGLEDDEPAPSVNLQDLAAKYESQQPALQEFPSGYYESDDGRALVMLFHPSSRMTGYEQSLGFRDQLRGLADQSAAEEGVQVHLEFGGDIEAIIQEQRSLRSDLITSSVLVALAESILLLAFFRWLPALAALGFPLAIGTLLTFAISYATVGSLNASTAFLGAIIVGNGVNAGIILLARFAEERKNGAPAGEAMQTAVRTTAGATAVASGAAALAYGSLMVTSFRGYSQFGFMGGLGMVLCWVSTYLFVPPLVRAIDQRWPVRQPPAGRRALWEHGLTRVAMVAVNQWKWVLSLAFVASALAAVAVALHARDPFEYDTTRLRSRWATQPGGYLEIGAAADRILRRVVTPAVVLLDSEEDAELLAQRYRALIASEPSMVLGSALTVQSLVPPDQPQKLEVLQRLRHLLRGSRLDALDPDTRSRVQPWLRAADLRPFTIADLPQDVQQQFRERDGSMGRMVLLFPKRGANTTDGRQTVRFAQEIRSVPLPGGAVVAGSYLVFADILASISKDGPLATVVALAAVVLLSLWLARGRAGAFAVSASLVAGVLWTVGAAAAGGMRINFLNFIALPITFGIGLDYAVNVFGRYRLGEQSPQHLMVAIGRSGGAVAICSATTVLGYGSLLLSRNGALLSFGLLAVVGELACLLAALVVLPALLTWRQARAAVPGRARLLRRSDPPMRSSRA